MSSDQLEKRLGDNDPWYTDPQLETLNISGMARGIRRRWGFFHGVLSSMQERRAAGGNDAALEILDAGCGDGVNLTFLSKLSGVRITAYEYNPVRVARVEENFPQVEARQVDLTRLEEDGRFDCILLSQVLEHIAQDALVIANLRKLLAPGGRLIVGVPNEGCLLARLRNNVFEPDIARTTDHVNFYTRGRLETLLSEQGLKIESVMNEGFFYPHQRLNQFFAGTRWGFRLSEVLGRVMPSQVGGYYYALSASGEVRPARPGEDG